MIHIQKTGGNTDRKGREVNRKKLGGDQRPIQLPHNLNTVELRIAYLRCNNVKSLIRSGNSKIRLLRHSPAN
jgi:hypothetical protein